MSFLNITNLSKKYIGQDNHDQVVFNNFSLDIPQHAIIAVIGPNGCGKTTLLNCIAGLTSVNAGTIDINNAANTTAIGFIFQNYRESLFPWLNNIDNVTCALELPNLNKPQKQMYIKQWAAEHNIKLPWNSYPYQCSGGQQQLLVLIREFINRPNVLLMDEPFAALDYEKHLAWRQQLQTLWEKTPTTIILVSHDIEEAIYLADEVIVLGNHPTAIVGRHKINLPRPRTPELLQEEVFFLLHRAVLQSFLQASNLL